MLIWLQGKKTYIIAILLSIFNIGIAFGLWTPDNELWLLVNAILAALGLGTLRAGMDKTAKVVLLIFGLSAGGLYNPSLPRVFGELPAMKIINNVAAQTVGEAAQHSNSNEYFPGNHTIEFVIRKYC